MSTAKAKVPVTIDAAKTERASDVIVANDVIVAVDIASDKFDYVSTEQRGCKQMANSEKGIQDFLILIAPWKPAMVVLEATGGYEAALVRALHQHHIPVALVNPGRVRHFAMSLGVFAKTDAKDAEVLLQYGRTMRPMLTAAPEPEVENVADLRQRAQQLQDMLTSEKNRLRLSPALTRESVQSHIDWLQQELDTLEKRLQKAIHSSDTLRPLAQLLCTIPGVGPVISATLIGSLPELGSLSHKKIAALAGLAPFAHDSGKFKGKRFIRGGRSNVRAALYMGVLTTIRFSTVFREYYDRLLKAGKVKKLALIACARKLLVTLNAMVKSNQKWKTSTISA